MKSVMSFVAIVTIAIGLQGFLNADVSDVYYHVGVNRSADGEPPSNLQVFSPYGGTVRFRFVDYLGQEYVREVDFDAVRSQKLLFSDLIPELPPELYYVEITGPLMAVTLDGDQNAGAGFSPSTELCDMQVLSIEESGAFDDAFRIYSEQGGDVCVWNEDLERIAVWTVPAGIPVLFRVPSGPNTSYVLHSRSPFAASWHDNPVGTLPLQCYHP